MWIECKLMVKLFSEVCDDKAGQETILNTMNLVK